MKLGQLISMQCDAPLVSTCFALLPSLRQLLSVTASCAACTSLQPLTTWLLSAAGEGMPSLSRTCLPDEQQ